MLKNILVQLFGANEEVSISQITVWVLSMVMAALEKLDIWNWLPGEVADDARNLIAFGVGAGVSYLWRRIYKMFVGASPASSARVVDVALEGGD